MSSSAASIIYLGMDVHKGKRLHEMGGKAPGSGTRLSGADNVRR